MKLKSAVIIIILCSGCAPIPMINRLSPYPAQGQSAAQIAADNNACEQFAAYQESHGVAAGQGAVVGTIGGAAVGAGSGAIIGSFLGGAGNGAGAGAAVGAVLGLLDGLAQEAQARDQIKVMAYRNCMVARGYVLP
jgi:hypothetical protein